MCWRFNTKSIDLNLTGQWKQQPKLPDRIDKDPAVWYLSRTMEALKPPYDFYLRAATGWLELGNESAAAEELEQFPPEMRTHPDVLELEFQILASAKKWDEASRIARTLVSQAPERVGGWIDAGYSARRATGGSVQAAYDSLLPAAKLHPADPLVPYNLACYACLLGRIPEARDWLETAYSLGNKRNIQAIALDETDLQPLWPDIKKMLSQSCREPA